MNVAPEDQDIGIGENNKKVAEGRKNQFLPRSGNAFKLTTWGLEDQFRQFNPDTTDRFSWFDYRSKGFDDDPKEV